MLYETQLPIFLSLIIHLAVTIAGFFIIGNINSEFDMSFGPMLTSLVIFIVIFLVIWCFNFAYYSIQAKRINDKLQN